jgi:uncharacterized protein with PIN domain
MIFSVLVEQMCCGLRRLINKLQDMRAHQVAHIHARKYLQFYGFLICRRCKTSYWNQVMVAVELASIVDAK